MDYAQLAATKGSPGAIRTWINHSDIDVDAVLEDAVAHIEMEIRTAEMRVSAATVAQQGHSSAPLPPGFLDPIICKLDNGFEVVNTAQQHQVDLMRFNTTWGGVDETAHIVHEVDFPRHYTVIDSIARLDGKMRTDVTLFWTYYRSIVRLSAEAPTNFLTARYPQIFRQACLKFANEYRHDFEAADRAAGQLEAMLGKLRQSDDLIFRGSM